jgi:hypothetical protein
MMPDRNDGRANDDSQAQFLRLLLSSERELFRYVAALVPQPGRRRGNRSADGR